MANTSQKDRIYSFVIYILSSRISYLSKKYSKIKEKLSCKKEDYENNKSQYSKCTLSVFEHSDPEQSIDSSTLQAFWAVADGANDC
jgi:hypothetical protein